MFTKPPTIPDMSKKARKARTSSRAASAKDETLSYTAIARMSPEVGAWIEALAARYDVKPAAVLRWLAAEAKETGWIPPQFRSK